MRSVVQGFFLSRFTKVVSKTVVIVIAGLSWSINSSGQTPPTPISLPDAEMLMKTDPPPPALSTQFVDERETGGKTAPVSSPSGEFLTRRVIAPGTCPGPSVSADSQNGGLNDNKTSPNSGPPRSQLPGNGSSQRGDKARKGFQWESAFKQSFVFLTIMHSFRLITEPETRAELRGPFFKEYFASVRGLRGWRDGDGFHVNYIGHPIQGAISGFIQIQNDPKAVRDLENTPEYWKSRLKAMGWAAIVSTQFELGPLGEAGVGNVGLKPTKKSKHPMGYVDLVITPTLGTAWIVGEDAVDRYLIRKIEIKTRNRVARAMARSFLNPIRSFANLLRSKPPWYRDNRSLR